VCVHAYAARSHITSLNNSLGVVNGSIITLLECEWPRPAEILIMFENLIILNFPVLIRF
jgi:hypothetical protein